jgi:hypothetical protein
MHRKTEKDCAKSFPWLYTSTAIGPVHVEGRSADHLVFGRNCSVPEWDKRDACKNVSHVVTEEFSHHCSAQMEHTSGSNRLRDGGRRCNIIEVLGASGKVSSLRVRLLIRARLPHGADMWIVILLSLRVSAACRKFGRIWLAGSLGWLEKT